MSGPNADGGPSLARRALFAVPVALVAGGILFFYGSLTSGRDPAVLPSALVGRVAPEATLPPLDGLQADGAAVPGFSRADLAGGQVTLVNVFASWCAPCRQEHPVLMRLKEQGVRIFGLNYKDTPENARRFLGGLGNPYERVGVDASGRNGIEWGVYGVPETFVVTGDGRIAFKFVGPLTVEAAEATLKPQIEKAKAAKPEPAKPSS